MRYFSSSLASKAGSRSRAFTMIELMIVIAIMAVVMSLSIPTFYRSLEKDTIRQATQKILDLCVDARAQAIISGRPCDLVIRPIDRTLTPILAASAQPAGEGLEAEAMLNNAGGLKLGGQGEDAGGENGNQLPDDILIMFLGVNFVPDLQNAEMVSVRFYPNGTGDEFTMLIRSDRNEWRKFTTEVATGVVKWEVIREN